MATTTRKPKVSIGDLSPEDKAALVAELRAEQAANAEPWAPGAEPRELTARERAVRLLLRERDHMDGCPLILDESRTAGRVEAYSEVRPANPARAEPAKTVTVARCIECGGARYMDGDVRTNIIASLEDHPGAGANTDTLDGSL